MAHPSTAMPGALGIAVEGDHARLVAGRESDVEGVERHRESRDRHGRGLDRDEDLAGEDAGWRQRHDSPVASASWRKFAA
jgi:hypothetical protein